MTVFDEIGLDPAWYEAVAIRTSRRRYTGDPVPADAMARLATFRDRLSVRPEVRIAIVSNTPGNIFTGILGRYGRIDDAPSAALFIGPRGSGESVGYVGEAFVLEATTLGVGTCWVAGTFDRLAARRIVDLAKGEVVICTTPLGTATARPMGDESAMRTIIRASSRKPIAEIAPGADSGDWPEWAGTAVGAARIGPSGSNRQPWRFRMEGGGLVLSCPPTAYFTADVDRGIAMLHVELGAAHEGVRGDWEPTGAPGVLRFVPRTGRA
jgi:nitroreductase